MRHSTVRPRHASLLLLACVTSSYGLSSNRTIDDQKGDSVTGALPTFTPLDNWNIGQTCFICAVHPGIIDPGQAFGGTWHDASHYGTGNVNITVQIDFTGTAIYMYNILVNTVNTTSTLTQLIFYLDGIQVGTFEHKPDESSQVLYNALVYKNTTLPNAPHSLQAVLSTERSGITLFDYAVYTVEDDAESPSQSSPTALPSSSQPSSAGRDNRHGPSVAAIAGGVVGGTVAFIAVLLAFLLVYRRRAQKRRRFSSRAGQYSTPARKETGSSGLAASPYTVAETGPRPYVPTSKLRLIQDDPELPPPATTTAPLPSGTLPASTSRATDDPNARTSPVERSAQLIQQIQALQAQVAELCAARGASAAGSADPSSDMERGLSAVLAAFRGEMAALRADLSEQQYAMTPPLELPPSYGGWARG